MLFGRLKDLENVAGKPLKNVEVSEDVRAQTRAICAQQHAAGYENDKDVDCFSSQFFLYENKANEENGVLSLA